MDPARLPRCLMPFTYGSADVTRIRSDMTELRGVAPKARPLYDGEVPGACACGRHGLAQGGHAVPSHHQAVTNVVCHAMDSLVLVAVYSGAPAVVHTIVSRVPRVEIPLACRPGMPPSEPRRRICHR